MRQPLRRQRQDHLVHPAQTPLPLLDQLRLERPCPVPRHSDLDRPRLGDHRLRPVPVAVVLPAALGPLTGLVPQVIGELALQGGLQYPFGQLLQQAALPGELHPTGLGPGHQLGDQPVIHAARRTHSGLPGPDVARHVSHQLPLPARELHRSAYRPRRARVAWASQRWITCSLAVTPAAWPSELPPGRGRRLSNSTRRHSLKRPGRARCYMTWAHGHTSLKFQTMPTSASETTTRPQSSVKTVIGL